nr:MAG: hypothetical protein [Actinidia virus B]
MKGDWNLNQIQDSEREIISFLHEKEEPTTEISEEGKDSFLYLVRLARGRGFHNLKHFQRIRDSPEPSRLKYAAKHIELVAQRLGYNLNELVKAYFKPTPLSYIIGTPTSSSGKVALIEERPKKVLTVLEFFEYLAKHVKEPSEDEYDIKQERYARVDISFSWHLLSVSATDINNKHFQKHYEKKPGIEKLLETFDVSRLLIYELHINSAACSRTEYQSIRPAPGGKWEVVNKNSKQKQNI